MAITVQIVGAILALCGLAGLVYGIDLLPTERGVAGVISAVVALSGGVITAALGLVIQRLETLIGGGVRTIAPRLEAAPAQRAEPARTVAEPAPEQPQRPRIEPRMAEPEMAELPSLPGIEHDAADIRGADLRAPEIKTPEVKQPEIRTERPKFSLPSFKLGAGAVAASAVAGVAIAKSAGGKVVDTLGEAADTAGEVAAAAVETVAGRHAAEVVDPPVEVLTPVDDLPEDLPPPPLLDTSAYVEVPMPEVEPEAPVDKVSDTKPVEDDPFASFEQELDKLIPLKPSKKAKGKRDGAPEMPAVTQIEPVIAEVAAAPVAPAPVVHEDIPPQVYAEAADLAPPPPAPAPGAEIVGAYESGGAKYTMYSDGSVVAEAEGQKLFFKSLEELREFIDGGVKG